MPGCSLQLLPLGSSAPTEAATRKVDAGGVPGGGPDGISAEPGRAGTGIIEIFRDSFPEKEHAILKTFHS